MNSNASTVGVVSSYNKSALRTARRRRILSRLPKLLLLTVVVLSCLAVGAQYLSKLPRERHARKAGFVERVGLGLQKSMKGAWLTLVAPFDVGKQSPLPRVELYIRGKKLDKLTENLPESGSEYQKAKVKLGGKEYKAEARFRGDSMNHWAFPQKSWRVRLAKDKFHEGHKLFNLNVPRSRSQMSNWLGYKIAERMRMPLAPHADFVHFRLNRQYDGVRLRLEQPGQEFLRARNLPLGKIYVGDISSEQIYGGVRRPHLYKESDSWEVRAATEEVDNREVVELLRIIREEHNPYEFESKMSALFDMPALTRYIALLDLVGSVHVDETHNGKFYFNPVKGKFFPIPWDTVAYFWGDRYPLDQAPNSLFRVVLSNPKFRAMKDEALWNAVHGELSDEALIKLIDKETERLSPDMRSFALKLHSNDKGIVHLSTDDWLESVEGVKEVIRTRTQRIKEHLSDTDVSFGIRSVTNGAHIGVKVKSAIGVRLPQLVLSLSGVAPGQPVSLKRRGLEDGDDSLKTHVLSSVVGADGTVAFELNDRLYSKRRYQKGTVAPQVVPGLYVYEISLPQGGAVSSVSGVAYNAVSGSPVNLEVGDFEVPRTSKKNAVWWDVNSYLTPSEREWQGVVRIEQDTVIGPQETVKVSPGATIEFAEGASLYVLGGRLDIVGSDEAPVTIRGVEPTTRWGVIAVNRGGFARLRNVNITGGTYGTHDFVRYDETLSVHDGELVVVKATMKDARISARYADLKLRDVEYENIHNDLLRVVATAAEVKNIRQTKVTPTIDSSLLEQPGFGTPKRVEREFKWSLSGPGLGGLDYKDVAQQIMVALGNSLDNGGWQAPAFTDTAYYADARVGDFLFRDLYFDTEQGHAAKHAISYRYRNRYGSFGAYNYHVKKPFWSEKWPHRLEFQAKVNRRELGQGFSTVEESRFEFRKQSAPFSEEHLPPSAPWDTDQFLPFFKAGHYKGMTTLPAQTVVRYLEEQTGEPVKPLAFRPEAVVVTERYRQHFNIKTPWGTGPNPEQAYIISLDHSIVYDAAPYVEYLDARKLGEKRDVPPAAGHLVEIEVEFERNVSEGLDREIEQAKQSGDEKAYQRLSEVREAFLADQKNIMTVLQAHFAASGIDVQPASLSKYAQAYRLLHE